MNVSHKLNNNVIETIVLSQPNVSGGCNLMIHTYNPYPRHNWKIKPNL